MATDGWAKFCIPLNISGASEQVEIFSWTTEGDEDNKHLMDGFSKPRGPKVTPKDDIDALFKAVIFAVAA